MIDEYKRKGWKTIRVEPRGKKPIEHDWPNKPPAEPVGDENVGLQTGRVSGFWVLDVDGEQGQKSLKQLEFKYGPLPAGPRQKSGSGAGWHYLFKCDRKMSNQVNAKSLGAGLDIRGEGGQIVVAPSVHPSGGEYEWQNLQSPVPDAPDWIYQKVIPSVDKFAPSYKGFVKWLEYQPDSVEGQDGNGKFMRVIKQAVRYFGLRSADDVFDALEIDYNKRAKSKSGQNFPWSYEEVERAFHNVVERYEEEGITVPADKRGNISDVDLKRLLIEDMAINRRLRFNQLKWRTEIDGETVSDYGEMQIMDFVFQRYPHVKNMPLTKLSKMMDYAARHNPYNPVKNYLEGVQWDGEQRLEKMCQKMFGPQPDLVEDLFVRWMVGAVARVFRPGCKMDNMLVVQGKQGARKSTFFHTLASEAFYSAEEINPRDIVQKGMAMQGVWIMEWEEIGSIWKGKENDEVKKFITCQKDTFRVPYDRHPTEAPRRAVLGATTNEMNFVKDPTGSRRFWVVQLSPGWVIPIDWLETNRDQIWAEATLLYKQGRTWHTTYEEDCWVSDYNTKFAEEDLLLHQIEQAIKGKQVIHIPTLLQDTDTFEGKNIARVMGNFLANQGWSKVREMREGKRQWVWKLHLSN